MPRVPRRPVFWLAALIAWFGTLWILSSNTHPGIPMPPIDGFGREGTFVLRTADDALGLRAFAQRQQFISCHLRRWIVLHQMRAQRLLARTHIPQGVKAFS